MLLSETTADGLCVISIWMNEWTYEDVLCEQEENPVCLF